MKIKSIAEIVLDFSNELKKHYGDDAEVYQIKMSAALGKKLREQESIKGLYENHSSAMYLSDGHGGNVLVSGGYKDSPGD